VGVRQRLSPTPEQAVLLGDFCAHERFLYNLAVEQFEFCLRHRRGGRQMWPSAKTRSAELTELRGELPWLAAGSVKVQQQALRIVDRAFRNWWSNPGHFRRPTYRSRYDWWGMSLVGAGTDYTVRKINRRWAGVRIPKCPTPIRFRLTVNWDRITDTRSCRITRDPAGRWFISFPEPQPAFDRVNTGATVGIDRGVANTLATSDGALAHMPGLTPKETERWRRLERRLARQQRGSRRRESTRRDLATLRQRLNDRRSDWVEQTTTRLVRDHDLIVIERLNVSGMTRTAAGTVERPGTNVRQKSGLNRAILAQRWGEFATRLHQKADATSADARVGIITVPAHHTSQQCRRCSHTSAENRKSQAVFACIACGHTGRADVEAAINIRQRGTSHNLARLTARGHRVAGRGDLPAVGSTKRQPASAAA
jgi:putative transposase